jgi:hypothetical protein
MDIFDDEVGRYLANGWGKSRVEKEEMDAWIDAEKVGDF